MHFGLHRQLLKTSKTNGGIGFNKSKVMVHDARRTIMVAALCDVCLCFVIKITKEQPEPKQGRTRDHKRVNKGIIIGKQGSSTAESLFVHFYHKSSRIAYRALGMYEAFALLHPFVGNCWLHTAVKACTSTVVPDCASC